MRKYRVRLLAVLGVVAVVAGVAGAGLLVWRGPWWFDGRYLDDKQLKVGSAALVTGFRTAAVQLLAVLGAGIALLFTAFNYRLTRRGQVTDRFTKALERLGSPEMYVRLGGILALEQIVQDAPDQAEHAAQVLNAFIRRQAPAPRPPEAGTFAGGRERITAARRNARKGIPSTPAPTPLPNAPAADVQQALTALTRPTTTHADLHHLHLAGAQLNSADLTHARLQGANLTHAQLQGANLTHAQLLDADLIHADLHAADLTGALLYRANLTGADFYRANLRRLLQANTGTLLGSANLTNTVLHGANLTNTRLDGANLTNTVLHGANLAGALLDGANLTGTDLHGANLTNTDLHRADLRLCRGLTAEQVLSAHLGSETQLPPHIADHPEVIEHIAAARM